MLKTSNGKTNLKNLQENLHPLQAVDGVTHAIAHSADEAARKAAEKAAKVKQPNLRAANDAFIKAQLTKTSRELAKESADLNRAVESLNGVIKKNRKAARKGRTRLLGGLAIGAALMYLLDPERGRQRRTETARRLSESFRGGAAPSV